MYEALEAMATIVTGTPTRDLSALREEFITKLRLPENYKEYSRVNRLWVRLPSRVTNGQQRSWPLDHEAESFVYMTGLFIRLAVESDKSRA